MNACVYCLAIFLAKVSSYKFLDSFKLHHELSQNTADKKNAAQKKVTKIEDVPHHTLIVYGKFFCSGSLIRSNVVATAASCFIKRNNQKIVVKLGVNTMTEPGQVISVVELKVHEYFDPLKSWSNDIALLALESHVKFSSATMKIMLVEPETALHPGVLIGVSSWGFSNIPHKYNNNLAFSEMELITREECIKHYKPNLISQTNFCAKYQIDRHLSDNGCGAVFNDLLVGVLSFGANKEEPLIAVFTNVSYFHRWITLNSRLLLEKYCTVHEKSDYYYYYYSEYYSQEHTSLN